MSNLYIFTVKYPYTKYAECFLEEEIVYLSERFEHITIMPLQSEGVEKKQLPINCNSIEPLFQRGFSSIIKGLYNWAVVKAMLPLLFKRNTLIDAVRRVDWLKAYYTACVLLNSKQVKTIAGSISVDDVCYFYWGKWSNVLAFFWRGKCHMVSRFHGEGDLWEEVHKGYVPLRNEVVKSLDAAVFISQKGERYFRDKYPYCKTKYFPLGSNEIICTKHVPSNVIKILSCSTVSPLKRVSLIFESLLAIKEKEVEWTHIGDGPEMENLKQLVKKTATNIKVSLLGSMNHDQVIDFYSKHSFDIFINLSTNEGVPVSIMEAISCNIPIVATNVGGTSEIVTDETGVLVSANPAPSEVADAISQVLSGSYYPRTFWERHFNAAVNYSKFADYLSNLD